MSNTTNEKRFQTAEEKLMTVRISYNRHTASFFIDFWDEAGKDYGEYIVSVKVSEVVAKAISRDTGINIMY